MQHQSSDTTFMLTLFSILCVVFVVLLMNDGSPVFQEVDRLVLRAGL
jgi:hypothetical protein